MLMAWEAHSLSAAVADVFGFHALQLGMPQIDALRANRMPHRWVALRTPKTAPDMACTPDLALDFHALPFPDACLDLVVLPHALETDANPHAVLREVARVLVPGGRVVITGLNPTSPWRWRFAQAPGPQGHQGHDAKIGYLRLRDWLRLLDFEVVQGSFGVFRPPLASDTWLSRWGWVERWGERWAPMLGAAYLVTGIKQVRGVRLMGQPWRTGKPARAQVATAQREPLARSAQVLRKPYTSQPNIDGND
jgi:SAM-dependent methyltransferase